MKTWFIVAAGVMAVWNLFHLAEVAAMKEEGLSAKQEKIVTIAALTANGDLQKLKTALSEGLDAGLTINEINEVLVQLYAYAGFPRSLNAINTFIAVVEERESKGIKDQRGKEPAPMPAGKSSIELGTENQTRLIGEPATGKYITFAPAIDQFLKAHLFGDIFGRNNLDFQNREIATIAALSAMEGVNPQLESHFKFGMNTGLTQEQMRTLVSVLKANVGNNEAENASAVLRKVLNNIPGAQSDPASVNTTTKQEVMKITRRGSQPTTKGQAEYFTGEVQVQPLFNANEPSRTAGALVTFKPGARSAWHTHPLGQVLIVTAGSGWVQQWGEQRQEIREGDVIWTPPGVKHWHGATATTSMSHIAIQEALNGNVVNWMEKVTDEQYLAKSKQ